MICVPIIFSWSSLSSLLDYYSATGYDMLKPTGTNNFLMSCESNCGQLSLSSIVGIPWWEKFDLKTGAVEETFDRCGYISTITKGRSSFKGWYLKDEIICIEAAWKLRIWSDVLDRSKSGCVCTTIIHSKTLFNDK